MGSSDTWYSLRRARSRAARLHIRNVFHRTVKRHCRGLLFLLTTACGGAVDTSPVPQDAGADTLLVRRPVDLCAVYSPSEAELATSPFLLEREMKACRRNGCAFLGPPFCPADGLPQAPLGCFPTTDCGTDLDCPTGRLCRTYSADDGEHPANGGCGVTPITRRLCTPARTEPDGG